MDLRGLRCFVGVAEQLNFSRAAQRLDISQPALSRQVKRLERELGAQLFDRIARRVRLTVAGEELLARARALLQDADTLRTRAHDLSGGSRGVLRVGATPQTLESLVSQLLTRYRRACPNVEVQLVEDGAASLLEQIERGLVNVAIAALPSGATLEGRVLFPLGVLAVVPAGHALGRRKSVELTELAGEPLLLLRKGFLTRQLFDGACQLAQLAPRVLLESSSPHCLLSLVGRRPRHRDHPLHRAHGRAPVSRVAPPAGRPAARPLDVRDLGSAPLSPARRPHLHRRGLPLHATPIPRQAPGPAPWRRYAAPSGSAGPSRPREEGRAKRGRL